MRADGAARGALGIAALEGDEGAVGQDADELGQTQLVAAQRAGVDLGVSVTGIAGPGGSTSEKPVGLVHIGVATKEDARSERHVFPGDRSDVRHSAMIRALEMLKAAAS